MLTVEQFVIKYNVAKDKEKFIKERIKDIHIPYSEKIAICENLVSITSYSGNEVKVFKKNSPVQAILFDLTIIDRYTDIKIDFANAQSIYDKLDELEVIEKIIEVVPEKELLDFDFILKMVTQDFYENNRSLVSFLETKVQALELALKGIADVFSEENIQLLKDKINNANTVQ